MESLPEWIQIVGMIAIAITAAVVGVFKYLKTEPDTTTSSTISASLIDSRLLKELIEALRDLQEEQSRDSKKTHRVTQDLKESINELNETMIVQTDATINLVKFINRENSRNRAADNMNYAIGDNK